MASRREIKRLTEYCLRELSATECEDTVRILHALQKLSAEHIGKLSHIYNLIFQSALSKKNAESGKYAFIKEAFHDLMVELATEIYI